MARIVGLGALWGSALGLVAGIALGAFAAYLESGVGDSGGAASTAGLVIVVLTVGCLVWGAVVAAASAGVTVLARGTSVRPLDAGTWRRRRSQLLRRC